MSRVDRSNAFCVSPVYHQIKFVCHMWTTQMFFVYHLCITQNVFGVSFVYHQIIFVYHLCIAQQFFVHYLCVTKRRFVYLHEVVTHSQSHR